MLYWLNLIGKSESDTYLVCLQNGRGQVVTQDPVDVGVREANVLPLGFVSAAHTRNRNTDALLSIKRAHGLSLRQATCFGLGKP